MGAQEGNQSYKRIQTLQTRALDLPSLLLLHRQVECLRRGLLPTAKVWGREKLFKDVFSGKSCIRSLLSCSTTAGGPAVRAVVVPLFSQV